MANVKGEPARALLGFAFLYLALLGSVGLSLAQRGGRCLMEYSAIEP